MPLCKVGGRVDAQDHVAHARFEKIALFVASGTHLLRILRDVGIRCGFGATPRDCRPVRRDLLRQGRAHVPREERVGIWKDAVTHEREQTCEACLRLSKRAFINDVGHKLDDRSRAAPALDRAPRRPRGRDVGGVFAADHTRDVVGGEFFAARAGAAPFEPVAREVRDVGIHQCADKHGRAAFSPD